MTVQVAKIGDYVTGKLVGKNDCRQGVLIRTIGTSSVLIRGESGDYICDSSVCIVPDKNIILKTTMEHVKRVRDVIMSSEYDPSKEYVHRLLD